MQRARSRQRTLRLLQDLQGIFWMQGNAIPEELAAMGLRDWNEEHKVLAVPTAPGTWSWLNTTGGQCTCFSRANQGVPTANAERWIELEGSLTESERSRWE